MGIKLEHMTPKMVEEAYRKGLLFNLHMKWWLVYVKSLKVHKRENFFGSDFELYTFL